MIAQSLGEYSAQGSIASSMQRLGDSIVSTVGAAPPAAWMTVGAIVLALLWFWSRRPSR
jgi:MYXO-CTERM domain-containing protein